MTSYLQSYPAYLQAACLTSYRQSCHPCQLAYMDQLLRLQPQKHPQGSCHLPYRPERQQNLLPWLQVVRSPNQQIQRLQEGLKLSYPYPCPPARLLALPPSSLRRHRPLRLVALHSSCQRPYPASLLGACVPSSKRPYHTYIRPAWLPSCRNSYLAWLQVAFLPCAVGSYRPLRLPA